MRSQCGRNVLEQQREKYSIDKLYQHVKIIAFMHLHRHIMLSRFKDPDRDSGNHGLIAGCALFRFDWYPVEDPDQASQSLHQKVFDFVDMV